MATLALTEKQNAVWNFILSYREAYQTLPSRADIQRGVPFINHYPSVAGYLNALIKKGYIQESDNNVGYIIEPKKLLLVDGA